jgi:hypothetical protein
MSSATTAGTVITPLPTLEDMARVKRQFDSILARKEWMLVSPDGRTWAGNPDKLLEVLASQHSLLKDVFTVPKTF